MWNLGDFIFFNCLDSCSLLSLQISAKDRDFLVRLVTTRQARPKWHLFALIIPTHSLSTFLNSLGLESLCCEFLVYYSVTELSGLPRWY